MTSERQKKKLYLYFIDYTKAFGIVRHTEIITQLTQLKIDRKDLRMMKKFIRQRQ